MMVEQSLQQNEENPIPFLTQREKEVLCCLARGDSNREIAAMLNIEERTVRFHLENLYRKLNRHGRGKLQLWAWKSGFGEM
jgi:two-component system nitrate/nitrite response regulator NarL